MTMNKTGLVVTKDSTDTADQEIGSRVDVRQRRQYQQINSHLSPFHTIRILKRAPGTKFLNLATIFFAMIKFYYFSQKQYHNCVKRVPLRAPSRQFFTQKFWVKSESTPVFLSKILSLSQTNCVNLRNICFKNYQNSKMYPNITWCKRPITVNGKRRVNVFFREKPITPWRTQQIGWQKRTNIGSGKNSFLCNNQFLHLMWD